MPAIVYKVQTYHAQYFTSESIIHTQNEDTAIRILCER